MTHNEAIRPSVVRVCSYVAVHTALHSSTPFVEFAPPPPSPLPPPPRGLHHLDT